MITKTSTARHLMIWETGSAKAVALGMEWLWEKCSFFLLCFPSKHFLTCEQPEMEFVQWTSSQQVQKCAGHLSWVLGWGARTTTGLEEKGICTVCWQFHHCGSRLRFTFREDVKLSTFTGLGWGWLGLTRPVCEELSQLPNFKVYVESQLGQ